jgi:hypothetical protein
MIVTVYHRNCFLWLTTGVLCPGGEAREIARWRGWRTPFETNSLPLVSMRGKRVNASQNVDKRSAFVGGVSSFSASFIGAAAESELNPSGIPSVGGRERAVHGSGIAGR